LTRGDQVVIFSISDKSKELLGLAKYVRSKKSSIVLITNHPSSPLAEYADHLIAARSETPSFMDSYASVFGIINALTLEIVKKDRIRVTERYKQIQKLRTDFAK
jgi:DNA-binding MurR/RpiR family transcriptional regulator